MRTTLLALAASATVGLTAFVARADETPAPAAEITGTADIAVPGMT